MNTTDSILMNMVASAQAAASNIQPAKPSSGGKKDGPSFQDLLQDKRQSAQPTDKADTRPAQSKEPEETSKVPGAEEQTIAAGMVAQNIVIMPNAQSVAETGMLPTGATEQLVSLAEIQQLSTQQTGQQTLSQTQMATPVAVQQTVESPAEELNQQQNVTQAQVNVENQPQVQNVQNTQTAEQQGDNGDNSELLKKDTEVIVTGENQQQPVFHGVESVPVKVGDAQPVDTLAPDMDEQFTAKLNQALDEGARRIAIKLTPENLGTVVVEMTQTNDGALHVVLHASGDKAMNLLSEHAANLGSLLQNGTQGTVQVDVQRQQESQQSQQQNQDNQQQQGSNHAQDQQQEHRQRRETAQDFLQQLRLGLIPMEN